MNNKDLLEITDFSTFNYDAEMDKRETKLGVKRLVLLVIAGIIVAVVWHYFTGYSVQL